MWIKSQVFFEMNSYVMILVKIAFFAYLTNYRRTCGKSLANVKNTRKNYCSCRAGAWYFHCYDSYVTIRKNRAQHTNNKPQLGLQHRHHHDKVRTNGISYALGLMRSIAYCQICLVNRKTDIVANMTLHVGIEEKWKVQCMYDPHFLAKGLNPFTPPITKKFCDRRTPSPS